MEPGRSETFRGGSGGGRSARGAGRGASRAPRRRVRHLSSPEPYREKHYDGE